MRLFLAIILFPVLLQAATYYVDFDAGNNANNGTSTGTAFKHCPGDTNATGTAASTTLSAGDIVKFKGGVSYNTPLKLNFNGSSGNPIIYDGNYDGNWGTGKAIIDRTNDYSNLYGVYTEANRSYVTIRNFEIRNVGGYASTDPVLTNDCTMPIDSPRTGIGISFYQYTCSGITIHDLWVHHCGQWRNQPPFGGAYGVEGGGIRIGNGSQIVISNCTVSFTKVGIALYASASLDNVTITKCDIGTNLVWGIDVATSAADVTFSNINIVATKIHDYHIYDLGNWLGCDAVPHTDGIFVRTSAYTGTTWTNVNVSECEFYSDFWGDSDGGTASIYVSQGPSVNIFNNTFIGDKQTRCIGVGFSNPAGTSPQVVRVYNNTFVTSGWPALITSGETDPAKRKVYFNNNLIVMNGDSQSANWTMIVTEDVALTELNYNLYYSTIFTVSQKYIAYMIGSGGYRKFADVQGLGFETNGLYVNPQLVDISHELNGSSSINNVRLLAASPARNTGINLSAYFLADFNDQPRGSAWDIGAFQYVGAVVNAGTVNIGTITLAQ